jgi:hypothetical protein
MLATWKDALTQSFNNIFDRISNFLPNLLGAVVILVLGWIVAVLLAKLIDKVLRIIGLQTLFEVTKVEDVVKKGKFRTDTTGVISSLVKWIILVIVFLTAADVLRLPQIVDFFSVILGFVPNVIAAVAVILIGAVLAKFLGDIVRGSAEAGGLAYANLLATITVWAIWVFAVLAALMEVGVASTLIKTLFTGFVALVAIAGGLAFGLGGQDAAKRLIGKIEKDLKARKEEADEDEMEI